jgi:hypothetical protein
MLCQAIRTFGELTTRIWDGEVCVTGVPKSSGNARHMAANSFLLSPIAKKTCVWRRFSRVEGSVVLDNYGGKVC